MNGIAPPVMAFRRECIRSVLPESAELFTEIESVIEWAVSNQLDAVVLAELPVGFWNTLLPSLRDALEAEAIALHCARHWWDDHFYPQAGSGFFKLKKSIPKALQKL